MILPVVLVNDTSVVIRVQTSLQGPAFNCLRQMPRSGIAVAYDTSMFSFFFFSAHALGLAKYEFRNQELNPGHGGGSAEY